MRVLLVISSLGGGGAERVMSRLAEAWAASGVHVTLATFDGRAGDFYRLGTDVHRRSLRDERGPDRTFWPGIVVRTRWLQSVIHDTQPSAIVSFTDRTNVVALLATRGTGLPVIVSERIDPSMHNPGRVWSWMRRLVYPRASAIVVQTEAVARWSGRHFPATCTRVISNPAPEHVPPWTGLGLDEIVAVGRLNSQKGFDVLIDAFSRIHQRHPHWRLRILGEGEERPRLEQQVLKRGLTQRVELAGRCSDALEQIARAGIFVLSSRYEGFPNVLVEAMACGRPVISTDCRSGPADMIDPGRNGWLVPVGDTGALAQALDRLISAPEERLRMGRAATELRTQLSMGTVLAQWNAVLAECGCSVPSERQESASGLPRAA